MYTLLAFLTKPTQVDMDFSSRAGLPGLLGSTRNDSPRSQTPQLWGSTRGIGVQSLLLSLFP